MAKKRNKKKSRQEVKAPKGKTAQEMIAERSFFKKDSTENKLPPVKEVDYSPKEIKEEKTKEKKENKNSKKQFYPEKQTIPKMPEVPKVEKETPKIPELERPEMPEVEKEKSAIQKPRKEMPEIKKELPKISEAKREEKQEIKKEEIKLPKLPEVEKETSKTIKAKKEKPLRKLFSRKEKKIEELKEVPEEKTKKEEPEKKVNEFHEVKFNQISNVPAKTLKDSKLIEKYKITIDNATAEVQIRKFQMGTEYHVYIPEIDVATTVLLNDLRDELITATTISMKELTDPNAYKAIKNRFAEDAAKLLKEKLPRINLATEKFLIGKLILDMVGLGNIEFLIGDPTLEEIVIVSAKEPIRIYSKKYGWLNTNITILREEDIINYANIIARRVGRQINILNPLLDAHLISGDRVNAVLYPVNTKGNTITIRKFARDPYTIIDMINNKTCDIEIANLIWIAMEFELNILISGGTASGKTSFLNACLPFIPPNQRILSIEDTRELMLPEFLYWSPLVTRTPNPEGKGEVSMLDLLVNSLRMRPDRIVLGEMRRHEEAMVLFEAMHTGHSVYATVHADSATETIARLTNPPMNVPPNLLKAVNLNVVMYRDRRKGIRKVLQLAEFEAEKDRAKANIIYRWSPEENRTVKHSESSRFFEDLSRHTGMNEGEIRLDLEEKDKILKYLIKNNIRSLEEFGKVMNLYYKNRDMLIKYINKNDKKALLK